MQGRLPAANPFPDAGTGHTSPSGPSSESGLRPLPSGYPEISPLCGYGVHRLHKGNTPAHASPQNYDKLLIMLIMTSNMLCKVQDL